MITGRCYGVWILWTNYWRSYYTKMLIFICHLKTDISSKAYFLYYFLSNYLIYLGNMKSASVWTFWVFNFFYSVIVGKRSPINKWRKILNPSPSPHPHPLKNNETVPRPRRSLLTSFALCWQIRKDYGSLVKSSTTKKEALSICLFKFFCFCFYNATLFLQKKEKYSDLTFL